jgi:predicted site-specific integrase-resolvase
MKILNGEEHDIARAVAERHGVHHSTIMAWANRGLLPTPIRIGNRCFFPRRLTEQMVGQGEIQKGEVK